MARILTFLYLLFFLVLGQNVVANPDSLSSCQLTFDPSIDSRQRYVVKEALSEIRCLTGPCNTDDIEINIGTGYIAAMDKENGKTRLSVPLKEAKRNQTLRGVAKIISDQTFQQKYPHLHHQISRLSPLSKGIEIVYGAARLLHIDILVSTVTEQKKIKNPFRTNSRWQPDLIRFRHFDNKIDILEINDQLKQTRFDQKQQIILAPYRRYIWTAYMTHYRQRPRLFVAAVFEASARTLETLLDRKNDELSFTVSRINKLFIDHFTQQTSANNHNY